MTITVKVHAGAKKDLIQRVDDKNYKVSTTTTPQKGKANQAVTNQLSKYFKVKKSQIILLKGELSPLKIFEVINN
jgi:uncharacterized protein (TIGR00251 family)